MMRYSLRDILWLTALCGLGAGWFVDHARQRSLLRGQKEADIQAAVDLQIEWLRRYRGAADGTAAPRRLESLISPPDQPH